MFTIRAGAGLGVSILYISLLPRFGCAVVAHQGRIYVGGGFGQDKAILCSVESYDPDTDKVSKSPLLLICSHLSYFSGQSCRTWKRFVALSAVFWLTDQYTSILIKTSELSSTEPAGKIRRCILNGLKMRQLYSKQPNMIFSFCYNQIFLRK